MNAIDDPSSSQSALLSFTAENVRSYRDEVRLVLEGTRMTEEGVARHLDIAGSSKPVTVLPAAGIFGANASGKTAILEAMDDMRFVVMSSFHRKDRTSSIFRRPFLLDDKSRRRPSRFEIELILTGVRWQYGFEIDDERVLAEYAYHYPRGRPAMVFDRQPDRLDLGPPFRASGRVLEKLVRDDSLFLSVAAAADNEGLSPLEAWFRGNLMLANAGNRGVRAAFTADLLQSPDSKGRVLSLLRYADLGVTDAHRESPDPESLDRVRKVLQALHGSEEPAGVDDELILDAVVRLTHSGPTGESQIAPEDESQGTQVWLGLIGPVLTALNSGAVLLVDELDASLHPHLVRRLINLFQDQRTNLRCAQIVFNSHDTGILGDSDQRVIGRDQIWFTKKDLDGVTTLYPLTDFAPRRDDALERRYRQGRYGAVPSMNPAEVDRALGLVDT
ncbi:MAG: ATP-binding protein [Acidimicrobiaceae bacterium]|nr:ATP-binding protein [Acidimicrobiaceae bacterium]